LEIAIVIQEGEVLRNLFEDNPLKGVEQLPGLVNLAGTINHVIAISVQDIPNE
jgi:hypothetical protein